MCVYQVVICRILYTHTIDNSLRYVFETSKMVAIQNKRIQERVMKLFRTEDKGIHRSNQDRIN